MFSDLRNWVLSKGVTLSSSSIFMLSTKRTLNQIQILDSKQNLIPKKQKNKPPLNIKVLITEIWHKHGLHPHPIQSHFCFLLQKKNKQKNKRHPVQLINQATHPSIMKIQYIARCTKWFHQRKRASLSNADKVTHGSNSFAGPAVMIGKVTPIASDSPN